MFSPKNAWIGKLGRVLLILSIWSFLILGGVVIWLMGDLPDLDQIAAEERRPSYVFVTEDNREIAHYGDMYGDVVTFKDIPSYLVDAVVATEDHTFFEHKGIHWMGIIRATVANLRAGHVVQGGSTLTQQLAKNLFLKPDRTFKRKAQELLLAFWLEHHFTKKQLLEIYLNRVYFGAGTYGVDAACLEYFGKPARSINMAEATVIAALLKAPSKLSPLRKPALVKERATLVAGRMLETGKIKKKRYNNLLKEIKNLNFSWIAPPKGARYFTDWLMTQLPDLVDLNQDLIIVTTLDSVLQRDAEHVIRDVMKDAKAEANAEQASFIALGFDGAVKALVGGVDYATSPFNRATQSQRQSGSAFKIFIYLAALELGLTPDTLVEDGPIDVNGWKPRNYGWQPKGQISITEGFQHSVNTVAVRLGMAVGVDKYLSMAKRLGLSTPQPRDLTSVLGAGSTSLISLTTAFDAVANGGDLVEPYGILEIRRLDGMVLYSHRERTKQKVLDPEIVKQMQYLMRAVMEKGNGRRGKIEGVNQGGKTGTTQLHRDAWFVGYTGDITAGVWVGNDKDTPMKRVTGASYPLRIWHRILSLYARRMPAPEVEDVSMSPTPDFSSTETMSL